MGRPTGTGLESRDLSSYHDSMLLLLLLLQPLLLQLDSRTVLAASIEVQWKGIGCWSKIAMTIC